MLLQEHSFTNGKVAVLIFQLGCACSAWAVNLPSGPVGFVCSDSDSDSDPDSSIIDLIHALVGGIERERSHVTQVTKIKAFYVSTLGSQE